MNSTRRTTFLLTLSALVVVSLLTTSLYATTIVDDSWADGGRDNGADALDTDWWTSSSSSAIEVSVGSLGLVTGGSGRGIRATFAPQALAIGDTIKATYTFTTPATIGSNKGGAVRVGMYDKLGRAGLEADLEASSGSPNPIYDGLPGYMADYDVALNTPGDANISLRKHDVTGTVGRLLGTTGDYDSMGSGGDPYSFAADTTYIGMFSITRTGADTADITSSLSDAAGGLLTTHTESDSSNIANNIGMLAFHNNSSTFGSSSDPDTADNGIDFSNVKIEVTSIPEPASIALLIGALIALPGMRRLA